MILPKQLEVLWLTSQQSCLLDIPVAPMKGRSPLLESLTPHLGAQHRLQRWWGRREMLGAAEQSPLTQSVPTRSSLSGQEPPQTLPISFRQVIGACRGPPPRE